MARARCGAVCIPNGIISSNLYPSSKHPPIPSHPHHPHYYGKYTYFPPSPCKREREWNKINYHISRPSSASSSSSSCIYLSVASCSLSNCNFQLSSSLLFSSTKQLQRPAATLRGPVPVAALPKRAGGRRQRPKKPSNVVQGQYRSSPRDGGAKTINKGKRGFSLHAYCTKWNWDIERGFEVVCVVKIIYCNYLVSVTMKDINLFKS